jgi:uncharacterized membrane protein
LILEKLKEHKLRIAIVVLACGLVFYALGIVTNFFGNPIFSRFWIMSNETANNIAYATVVTAIAMVIIGLTVTVIKKRKTTKPQTTHNPVISRHQTLFITAALIGILILASPTIALFIKAPVGQQFSVIYLLGPNRTFDNVPFNIKTGVIYSVYLGVTNYMESSNYYACSVKIASQNDGLPDSTLGTPSSLPTLYEYKTFLTNGKTWEAPLTFEVNSITFENGASTISDISINGLDYSVNKVSVWDSSRTGYYYILIVELSLYNSNLNRLIYNNRFVDLNLNITQ